MPFHLARDEILAKPLHISVNSMDTLTTPGQKIFVYDLEIYPNYFLALFKVLDDEQWHSFAIEESVPSQKNENTY